jgi:hypothetical protein
MHMHIEMHMPLRLLMPIGLVPRATRPAPAGRVQVIEWRKRAGIGIGEESVERGAEILAFADTKNARRTAPPGESLLAPYLTWRQEAANHHEDQL